MIQLFFANEKNKEEKIQKLKYNTSKNEDDVSEIILSIFNESIRQCFINILPKKPVYVLNQE